MDPARRRTLLFILCAAVLLGAGFSWGYLSAYGRFYSVDALIDRELIHMDFNTRLLHYTNVGNRPESRRELVRRLRMQVTFINEQIESNPGSEVQESARASVRQARRVIDGQPIIAEKAAQGAVADARSGGKDAPP